MAKSQSDFDYQSRETRQALRDLRDKGYYPEFEVVSTGDGDADPDVKLTISQGTNKKGDRAGASRGRTMEIAFQNYLESFDPAPAEEPAAPSA